MMYNIQTEGSVITAFDVSSTYQAISFVDSGGKLVLNIEKLIYFIEYLFIEMMNIVLISICGDFM